MSRARCMVVVLVVLVVTPQKPAPDPLLAAVERRTFMDTNVFARMLAPAAVRVANGSAREGDRGSGTTQVDLSEAELLRAQLVLLDGMNGMSQALDAARRNPAFVHDRPLRKALGAASDDFTKMSKAFHSMVKELTLAVHGAPVPSDGARVK